MINNGKFKVFLLIGAVILAATMLSGYFFFQSPKREPLPNPNGYDDLVAAGEMVKGEIPDWKTVSVEELRQFVSSNQVALDRGRLGLTKQCCVPVEYSATWISDHISELTATKKLAQALFVEAKLAELEKRPDAAAASCLSAIKLGAMVAHGGLMIDALVAVACEGVGEQGLASEVETLDAEMSRNLIIELEKVETEKEPSAQIIKHENMWAKGQLRSFEGIKMYLQEVAATRSFNASKNQQQHFLAVYDSRLQWELQLKAKLAAHAYALEKGRLATNWNDLVPVYLKTVPNVPFGPDNTNRLIFKTAAKP